MGKKEILLRENRIKALTDLAVRLFKEGYDEITVEEQLKEAALENWGVSTTTIYNYTATALRRAKKYLGLNQGGPQNVQG